MIRSLYIETLTCMHFIDPWAAVAVYTCTETHKNTLPYTSLACAEAYYYISQYESTDCAMNAWFILTISVQSDTLASGRVDTCVVCFGYILSSDVARAIDTLNITAVHSSWAVCWITVQMQLLACSGHIKVVVLLGTTNNLHAEYKCNHMHNHAIIW